MQDFTHIFVSLININIHEHNRFIEKRFYKRETIPFIRVSLLHWLKVRPINHHWLRTLN